MSLNICLDDIFRTTEHFVTKLGMVMQHYEPECHVQKELFAVVKVKVTEGSYDQNTTLSTISSELLTLLQPNLVYDTSS